MLDLYLGGDFPKEMLTDRKKRLEMTINNLMSEKAKLVVHVETKMLTEDQIRSIKDFAGKIRDGLAIADDDFATRRRIIEMLDIQVTLVVEDGHQVIYVQ